MKQITNTLADLFLVLLGISVGMIFGAVIAYSLSAVIYQVVDQVLSNGTPADPMRASEECARGMAVGYLSIAVGALFGTVIGGVGTLKLIDSGDAQGKE